MANLGKLSFCLAEDEIEALEALRQRLGLQGVLLNRSEVLRVALRHLAAKSDADIVLAAQGLSRLKPGRRARSNS